MVETAFPAPPAEDEQLRAFWQEISYLSVQRLALVEKAYHFAARAHSTQSRKSGEPYITHPLEVARILAAWKMDAYCLCAALLHDVMEDCGIERAELSETFGPLIGKLVDGLSKLKKSAAAESPVEYGNLNLRKLLKAAIRDKRVVLVKLADRLHNIRTLQHKSRSSQIRITRETLDIYAPLARRMGLYDFYRELADTSFAIRYPLRYRVVKNAVIQNARRAEDAQNQSREQLGAAFESASVSAKFLPLPFSLYSYYTHWRNRELRLDAITGGARWLVLVQSEEDCYRALWQIHRTFTPRLKDFHDWIATPKRNGYRSLHTQVNVAGKWSLLVIRDLSMNRIAQSGALAGLGAQTESLSGELRNIVDRATNTDLIDEVRDTLRVRRITVYAPDGRNISLAEGATALDFAFRLSRTTGLQAQYCHINGCRESLSTPLQDGSTVDIRTSGQDSVSPEWMGFVTTQLARKEIRRALEAPR